MGGRIGVQLWGSACKSPKSDLKAKMRGRVWFREETACRECKTSHQDSVLSANSAFQSAFQMHTLCRRRLLHQVSVLSAMNVISAFCRDEKGGAQTCG